MGKTEELETLITALEKEHKKLREMQSATDINVGTNEDCISRQAAVDYCKKMLIETALNNVGFICNADELLLDIEENRIETWLSHVPPAQPEQRWIPVWEKLPEEQVKVLVTDFYDIEMAYLNAEGRLMDFHGDKLKGVTAWMPLPEPYQQKG